MGNLRAALIFLSTFPLQEYFFPYTKTFSGLLAVREFFSLNFPSHDFFGYFAPPPHNFSNGPSLSRRETNIVNYGYRLWLQAEKTFITSIAFSFSHNNLGYG